jgi:hypothetical protein
MVCSYDGILFSHKKKKVLIHIKIWMNLENMPNKISWTQKTIYFMIHLCEMSRSGKYEGEKMCISDCQGLGNKGRMDSD